MSDQTLRGDKLSIYVIVKILKYCTGSSAKSYQCKFSIGQAFVNSSLETIKEMGAAIKEVIHSKSLRGKFSSVHPDLVAEGITRVEVEEEGLRFITNNPPGLIKQPIAPNIIPNIFNRGHNGCSN